MPLSFIGRSEVIVEIWCACAFCMRGDTNVFIIESKPLVKGCCVRISILLTNVAATAVARVFREAEPATFCFRTSFALSVRLTKSPHATARAMGLSTVFAL